MQIKTFSAPSTAAVLAKIKEELGPDAVILDTEEADGMITMTAALERVQSAPDLSAARPGYQAKRFGASGSLFPPPPGESDSFFDGIEPPVTYSPRGRMRAAQDDYPDHELRQRPAQSPKQRPAQQEAQLPAQQRPAQRSMQEAQRREAREDDYAASPRAKRTSHAAVTPESGKIRQQDAPKRAPRKEAASARQSDASSASRYATSGYEGIPGLGSSPYGAPPGWQQWHEEWSSIKNHLLALMKPALRLDQLPPRQRLAIEFLQKEGVEDEAILELLRLLQETDPSESILVPLSTLVPVRPWGYDHWPQRIQLVTGPFGAGKTSVAIRMALSMRRTAPACRICLVNADATRGNGRLLLRHYCDLSDMAYKEAGTTLELVGALNEALREDFDLILVDLPGISRGRFLTTLVSDAGLARLTPDGEDDIAVHLAMPPHFGSLQMRGVLERYHSPHAGSIVWTKLDEAEHYGQIVNAAVSSGLPVSALSFGPGLGNSLAPVKGNMLWRLLFKKELPAGQ